MHCIIRWVFSRNTHGHTHTFTQNPSLSLFLSWLQCWPLAVGQIDCWSAGQAERQILFLDQVNLDPLPNTHTNRGCVSDTDLRVKCTPLIWRPICSPAHLSTEPLSWSKSTDNLTNLNSTLSDRNLHTASLNYSTVWCFVCIVCSTATRQDNKLEQLLKDKCINLLRLANKKWIHPTTN